MSTLLLRTHLLLQFLVLTTHRCHGHIRPSEDQIPSVHTKNLYPIRTYPGDNEASAEAIFSGITTFAYLPWVQCLGKDRDEMFDIAFIGAPFDTGTSYRPGARFGPSGIRAGSRRTRLLGGYNVPLAVNPFSSDLKIVDCGDLPLTPYDSVHAIKQIEDGHKALLHRTPFSPLPSVTASGAPPVSFSKDGKAHPRLITLGGDHTIVLPTLRSIYSAYGPVSIIHFDSHLDTWKPSVFGGSPTDGRRSTMARTSTGRHGAIRTTLSGPADYENDDDVGFQRIEAREIDIIGTAGIIQKIRDTVGGGPVYLSIDIDTIDPAFAPATGTPETGGWTTRELRSIIRGLDGLKIVSADLVEVAPVYDTIAEQTTIAAADILYEVLSVMVKTPLVGN